MHLVLEAYLEAHVCVCVSHPGQRVFHHLFSTTCSPQAGGQRPTSKRWLTKLCLLGGCGQRRLTVYLLRNCCPRCPLLWFVSWCFMSSIPKTGFPTQTCSRLAVLPPCAFRSHVRKTFVETSTIALTFHLTVEPFLSSRDCIN